MATCRFDCAPPQIRLDPSGLHTNAPGGTRHPVRTFEKGEVIGPTVGPAIRRKTIHGDFVSVPIRGTKTEGAPELWMKF
eukprot:7229200-Pyramimonas_sp.AAC.1